MQQRNRIQSQYSLLPVLLTALLLTTNVNAQQNARMDGWPQWAKDSMAQEVRKPKFRTVKTPDGTFRTKMPGKRAEPEAIEDGWYFQSDIEAGSPLECYIFTNPMDLATLTDLIAENNIEAVGANNNGTIDNRGVFHTEAGSIGGVPYLALEWNYTINSNSETLLGFTKVRAATKGDMAFACAHNYLGYRETFANAFSQFVENAKYEDTTPVPYYEEIARFDFNGLGSGIGYVAFTIDEDGDTKMYATEAMITPVDAATLITTDAVTITYSMPGGELINSINVNVENGELASNLSLQRDDAGDWLSSGTLKGKPINVKLDGALSPTTTIGQMALTRELFASSETSVSMDVWASSIDPTQLLESVITRDDAEIEGRGKLTLGPINYIGRFDEYGNMINAEMHIGPASINFERIWSRGMLEK